MEGIRLQTLSKIEVILANSCSTDSTLAFTQGDGARIGYIKPKEFTPWPSG